VERALGAGAFRVGRRRFAEAGLLCGVALAIGTGLAASWIDLLRAYPPPLASIVFEPAWDWRVWAWTLAATLTAIAVASAAPVFVAIRAGGSPLQTMDAGPSRGARRLREALVALQVAVACVILAATGLVLRTVLAAHRADLGFRADGLVMADVELLTRVPDAGKRRDGLRQVMMRLRERPEVLDAALSNLMPLTVFRIPTRVRDASGASLPVHSNGVSEDYFRTLDLKLERGRGFSPGKAAGSEVVVNQTLARMLHPSGGVLGKTLDVLDVEGRLRNRLSIVGVARDARYHTLWQERIPYFYTHIDAPGAVAVVVRSRSSTEQAWRAIRESVERAFPGILVSPPSTARSQLSALVQEQGYLGAFFGMLAAIALIVASGGLMASLYLMVSQRTREIGIRQALGATRATILGIIVTRGVAVACGGLLVGVVAGACLERLLRPLAPGTRAGDPLPLAVAFSLLLLMAFAAALGPALRAARIQPWNAIRHPE
jgi:hypothetical protein